MAVAPGRGGNEDPRGSRGVWGSQCKSCGLQLGSRGIRMSWRQSGDGLGLAAPSQTFSSLCSRFIPLTFPVTIAATMMPGTRTA